MKHTLIEEIDCGEFTCASEPGKFCKFLGSSNFGTQSRCMYFRDKDWTNLHLDDTGDGWVQRAGVCLDLFRAEEDDTDHTFDIYWSAVDRLNIKSDDREKWFFIPHEMKLSLLRQECELHGLSQTETIELVNLYVGQFGLYDGPKREETFFPVFNNEDRKKLGLPLQ